MASDIPCPDIKDVSAQVLRSKDVPKIDKELITRVAGHHTLDDLKPLLRCRLSSCKAKHADHYVHVSFTMESVHTTSTRKVRLCFADNGLRSAVTSSAAGAKAADPDVSSPFVECNCPFGALGTFKKCIHVAASLFIVLWVQDEVLAKTLLSGLSPRRSAIQPNDILSLCYNDAELKRQIDQALEDHKDLFSAPPSEPAPISAGCWGLLASRCSKRSCLS
jgi:hypothetical protein